MVDRYLHGKLDRISPEAPVPILSVERTEDRPGGAANVAMNCSALRAKVTLFGVLALDATFQNLATELGLANILIEGVSEACNTTTKIRLIANERHILRIDEDVHNSPSTSHMLLQSIAQKIHLYDALLVSDYNKGALNNPSDFIDSARSRNVPVFSDPKRPSFEYYRGSSVLKPNAKEFYWATGCHTHDPVFSETAFNIITNCELEALVVTDGGNGAYFFDQNGGHGHELAPKTEIKDVTGAGDVMLAHLAISMCRGESLRTAVKNAVVAASSSVRHLGTTIIGDIDDQ